MNFIDLGILGIIVVSVFIGMYHGFTISLFNIASFIVSWFFSLLLHRPLTRAIIGRYPDILEKIIYYSEGSSKISFGERILPVSSLSPERISAIVNESGLPNPFRRSLEFNLTHQNLKGIDSLGQYFDYTVGNVIINLISFILIFLALQLLFTLIISLTSHVATFPVLRKHDSLTAGALGFVRGILFLFILFAFLPLLYLVIPADFLGRFLDSSKLIGFFLNANFITSFVKGFF